MSRVMVMLLKSCYTGGTITTITCVARGGPRKWKSSNDDLAPEVKDTHNNMLWEKRKVWALEPPKGRFWTTADGFGRPFFNSFLVICSAIMKNSKKKKTCSCNCAGTIFPVSGSQNSEALSSDFQFIFDTIFKPPSKRLK